MSIGDNTIAAYAAELMDLEDAVDAAQGDKKFFFENAREAHGKDFAKSLKLAVKIARTEPEKLQEAEAVEAEAERFLGIIRQGLAARGARTREIIEEFPPETADQVPATTNGGSDESEASAELVNLDRRHQSDDGSHDGAALGGDQRQVTPETNHAPAESAADEISVPKPKRITFNDKPHPDCLDTDRCGGLSNLGLCQRCKEAAA
jgi:hypothetical protein